MIKNLLRTNLLLVPLFLFGILLLMSGCATTQPTDQTHDPFEGFNRSSHQFNAMLDEYLLKPVSDTYVAGTHPNLRLTVSNFYDNLNYLNVISNDFLQGKFKQGALDTGRFIVNTTIGVAGFFDAATAFGFERHHEDFGQTLAVWGVGQGPYIEAPLLGPTTGRDVFSQGSNTLTNPITYISLPVIIAGVTVVAPILILGVIDARSRVDAAIQARDEIALDTYVFTREAYLQERKFKIHDGNPPDEDLYDENLFDGIEESKESVDVMLIDKESVEEKESSEDPDAED